MLEISLIKSRIRKLSKKVLSLKTELNYSSKEKRLADIANEIQKSNIWEVPKYAKDLSIEFSLLKDFIKRISDIIKSIEDISNISQLIEQYNDEDIFTEIVKGLDKIEIELKKLEFYQMFSGKHDSKNCYMDIQAGSGGIDAQDWANMLLRMYLRWSEINDFSTEVIEESIGDIAGIKSVTIRIVGNYAYGWLRGETGVHRLVRRSPFDANRRRHTSFSSVFVYPEENNDINVTINPNDLRIDVYRSSGAGGQHVNKTESAVRITHLPTNIVTQCQNDRSQHKNREQAMRQLKAKLYEFELYKKNAEKQSIEDMKSYISWGRQIRSYILDDSRIKDLRTGIETRDVQSVLNGYLNEFIEANLKLKT